MIELPNRSDPQGTTGPTVSPWQALADRVLSGHRLSCSEAVQVLESPDHELLDLLSAAFRIRRHYFGLRVKLHFLVNAKSGLCPEDCSYCSQSRVSTARVPKYQLLGHAALLEGARTARARNAGTLCIAIAGRGPSQHELEALATIVPEIKRRHPLKICVSLGLLTRQQAERLKACGVDRVNHNLNTSSDFYPQICTTHTYQDRLETLRAVRDAGLEICSGGIVGMGEQPIDVVRMVLLLRDLNVQSIPVNFLNPIGGTPLEQASGPNARDCLRVLAMVRLANPQRDIRIAGGREVRLRSLQPLGLYPANSIFVGDYLTTTGQPPEADLAMIDELGFTVDETM
ncbi:MAG: biotin synthase BioB [Planctomycetes bacterium RBG_16_64_10]|nr:MAG: biotin synthase BioB [Planctomycetes bacterium RBG_16_64_10]